MAHDKQPMAKLGKRLTWAAFFSLLILVAVPILGCAGLIPLPKDMSQEDQVALIQELLWGLIAITASLFVLAFLAKRRAR
jgi:hypothetical protein